MELHEAKLAAAVRADVPPMKTVVMPIGDMHYGAAGCAVDRLQKYVEWGVGHGVWWLGMGDYLDIASPSNRYKLRNADFYDSTAAMIENAALRMTKELSAILAPTKGRWLGMLQGHHYAEFENLDEGYILSSDQILCQDLGAPFLGSCAMIDLRFGKPVDERCTIWCHHGAGSGLTLAAPLNRLERLVTYFDADIYLVGHQHKLVAAPLDRLYTYWRSGEGVVQHRTKLLACTGGFLRGYEVGNRRRGRPQGDYTEKGMYHPTALGGILLTIQPRRTDGFFHPDIRVEL